MVIARRSPGFLLGHEKFVRLEAKAEIRRLGGQRTAVCPGRKLNVLGIEGSRMDKKSKKPTLLGRGAFWLRQSEWPSGITCWDLSWVGIASSASFWLEAVQT